MSPRSHHSRDVARRGTGPEIWFCGDPHGRFRHIVDAVKRQRPDALVLLGDIEAKRPLQLELAEILTMTEVHWIAGNHDSDSECAYDNLFGSELRDRNLHARVVNIAGVKVAGLGGIFRERVWMPPAEPIFQNEEDFLRMARKETHWRGGLPLRHRSTIFAHEYHALAKLSADVLVTHGAPYEHPHGNEAYDLLAIAMGATKLFHGHEHDSLPYRIQAIRMFGVGLRGITSLDGTKIVPGEQDDARADRRLK